MLRVTKKQLLASSCAAVALGLAGCGSAPPPPIAPEAKELQPRGGVLQLMHSGTYRTLDPHQETAPFGLRAAGPAYDTIVKFDPSDPTDARIVPGLAEKWEQESERTYVFTFRDGVKWHDGEPFSAEDARFSLDRIANPPKGVTSPRKDWFTNVDRLEAPDARTLRVALKRPEASFLPFLAAGWSVVAPKHLLEQDQDALTQRAVGTGPFRFERANPQVEGMLVRNDDYFVKDKPIVDGIRWVFIADQSTQFAAFQAKQIDLLQLTSAAWGDAIRRDMSQVKIQNPPSSLQVTFRLRMDRPPFDDLRVRQAVHMAINRPAVIQGAMQGFGLLPSPMPPDGSWGMPESELLGLPGFRKPKEQDLSRARGLMQEAGYGGGFTAKMLLGQYDYVDNAGLIVADQLKALNIKLETEKVDFSLVLQRMPAGTFETAPYLAGLRVDDPNEWLIANYKTGGSRNWGKHSDAQTDDLLERQSITLDAGKRREQVKQLSARILDQASQPPLFWLKTEVAMHPWVRGYVAHGNSTNDYQHLDTWIEPALKR